MDNRSLDDERPPKEVTAVVSRKIKTGFEKDYDDWGRRYMMLERKVPGYLGSTIIVPGGSNSSVRYILNRFSDEASLDAWEKSEEALRANGRSEQLLYSILRESDWSGDVVSPARLENYSCSS